MEQEKQPRPRGGQPKDPAERKSSVVTFRMRDQLKEGLESSARFHGRTLSEEIGYRLERSFIEGRALENMTAMVKLLLRDAGATDAEIQELVDQWSHGSPDAAAQPAALSRIFANRPTASEPAATGLPLDEEAVFRAVTRALRETLPPTLTNRGAPSAPPDPPTVTPQASPAEQAAWTPVVEQPVSDEPARDGQPAKGQGRTPAE